MNKYRVLSTCTADLSDKLPFEGWSVPGWNLGMSNRVTTMMKTEAEERFRGGGGGGA